MRKGSSAQDFSHKAKPRSHLGSVRKIQGLQSLKALIAWTSQTDREREKEGAQTVLGQGEGMAVVIGLVERSS